MNKTERLNWLLEAIATSAAGFNCTTQYKKHVATKIRNMIKRGEFSLFPTHYCVEAAQADHGFEFTWEAAEFVRARIVGDINTLVREGKLRGSIRGCIEVLSREELSNVAKYNTPEHPLDTAKNHAKSARRHLRYALDALTRADRETKRVRPLDGQHDIATEFRGSIHNYIDLVQAALGALNGND